MPPDAMQTYREALGVARKMKETTKLLKQLGKHLFGCEGKTKNKVVTVKHDLKILELENHAVLALEFNIETQSIFVFKEWDHLDQPSYRIPKRVLYDEHKWGKCPICGNLAVLSIHGNIRFGECIEPPNFHRFNVDSKAKARE
jgi:hypothetical protein